MDEKANPGNPPSWKEYRQLLREKTAETQASTGKRPPGLQETAPRNNTRGSGRVSTEHAVDDSDTAWDQMSKSAPRNDRQPLGGNSRFKNIVKDKVIKPNRDPETRARFERLHQQELEQCRAFARRNQKPARDNPPVPPGILKRRNQEPHDKGHSPKRKPEEPPRPNKKPPPPESKAPAKDTRKQKTPPKVKDSPKKDHSSPRTDPSAEHNRETEIRQAREQFLRLRAEKEESKNRHNRGLERWQKLRTRVVQKENNPPKDMVGSHGERSSPSRWNKLAAEGRKQPKPAPYQHDDYDRYERPTPRSIPPPASRGKSRQAPTYNKKVRFNHEEDELRTARREQSQRGRDTPSDFRRGRQTPRQFTPPPRDDRRGYDDDDNYHPDSSPLRYDNRRQNDDRNRWERPRDDRDYPDYLRQMRGPKPTKTEELRKAANLKKIASRLREYRPPPKKVARTPRETYPYPPQPRPDYRRDAPNDEDDRYLQSPRAPPARAQSRQKVVDMRLTNDPYRQPQSYRGTPIPYYHERDYSPEPQYNSSDEEIPSPRVSTTRIPPLKKPPSPRRSKSRASSKNDPEPVDDLYRPLVIERKTPKPVRFPPIENSDSDFPREDDMTLDTVSSVRSNHGNQYPEPNETPYHPDVGRDDDGFRHRRSLNTKPKDKRLPVARKPTNSQPLYGQYGANFYPGQQQPGQEQPLQQQQPNVDPNTRQMVNPENDMASQDSGLPPIQGNDATSLVYDPHEFETGKHHSKWPIFKIERQGGLACLVRTSPGVSVDYKQGLHLHEKITQDEVRRLPDLPYMDFDADERLRISPMKFVWKHSIKEDPAMTHPIYFAFPVNADLYNDVLQQIYFLYTTDLREWRLIEGKVVKIRVDGVEHDFLEIAFQEDFHSIIFDIKARYWEDVKEIDTGGGDVESTMEPGIRVHAARRVFDEPSKVKIRIEPLDMNETELYKLIPAHMAAQTMAVSPIIKITSSQPTKRHMSVFVPKPGFSTLGSVKLGLKTRIQDLRSVRVHLFTKEKQITKYLPDGTLQRELANEFEFQIRIWRLGGCCYCVLVLEGIEPTGQAYIERSLSTLEGKPREGFMTGAILRELASEIEDDDIKMRSLGRHLLNISTTQDIMRQHEDNPELAAYKVLRRWQNQNRKADDKQQTKQLVKSLRESGFAKEAVSVQDKYREHLLAEEGSLMLMIFEEMKSSPALLVNWKLMAKNLGLAEVDIRAVQTERRDLRRRCSSVLKKAFETFRLEENYYRNIALRYIRALHKSGCPRIAASIERRHLPKFFSKVD